MSVVGQRPPPPPHNTEFESSDLKHRAESELLVKLGAKEEEFDWHPDILYRRPERPRSSISLDYPLDLKVGRPKTAGAIQNRNPWVCDNPALRQLTLVSRHGPRARFLNRAQFSDVHTTYVRVPYRM